MGCQMAKAPPQGSQGTHATQAHPSHTSQPNGYEKDGTLNINVTLPVLKEKEKDYNTQQQQLAQQQEMMEQQQKQQQKIAQQQQMVYEQQMEQQQLIQEQQYQLEQQQMTAKEVAKEEEDAPIEVKPIVLDRATLERYVELEKQIHSMESKNITKNLELKSTDLNDFGLQQKTLEESLSKAKEVTAKEKADVDNVKAFFADHHQFEEKFTKEQEEYLEALNAQEIIQKELEAVNRQIEAAKAEVETLTVEKKSMDVLYKEQDELLAAIFNGEYGSDLEDRLEQQLDKLLERKQRVSIANYKWANSRVLLNHAVNQLSFAVKKWGGIADIPANNMQGRYTMSTEVRNNLIAANQNISSAQRYLSNITFPYCKADEMATLTKATNNIYTDMQTTQRHGHAMNCYNVTYKRACALLQWFDMVINKTISKDLDAVAKMAQEKEKELRAERLALIKAKIRESQMEKGEEESNLDIDNELEFGDETGTGMRMGAAAEADAVGDAGDLEGEKVEEGLKPMPEDIRGGSPLPSAELAPAPDALFDQSQGLYDLNGNIDELKKQHEREIEEFNKAQDLNKARMQQGLQEKLAARRSRKKRQNMVE